MSYQQAIDDLYREAAQSPIKSLCCVSQPPANLPGLVIPDLMFDMNYGCGSAAQLGKVTGDDQVLYIGVGGGLELLQLAWMTRADQSVIGVDRLPEMLEKAKQNLEEADLLNAWFDGSMVRLLQGDALSLPLDPDSVTVVAQNCVFNMFELTELEKAISETYRVLKPNGRLMLSDPVSTEPVPKNLKDDERLRAMCLSGALTLDEYLELLTDAGFGQVEVHKRRPYRMLTQSAYNVDRDILLYAIEVTAYKVPVPADGPCVFTGRTATYVGTQDSFDDGCGHHLIAGIPLDVCDKTAAKLASLCRDIVITDSTWHYNGGGCC